MPWRAIDASELLKRMDTVNVGVDDIFAWELLAPSDEEEKKRSRTTRGLRRVEWGGMSQQ
jgi:hypothetical protein